MRLIEKQGHLGIDKAEIDALIAAKNFIGLNRSPRKEKIILSMTTYTPRINDVKYAIYSLLNQTFPPDKFILWLNDEFFPRREEDLPRDLLALREFGLTIGWCENLRPHTKYFYALEKYPDDLIVTADDDNFYMTDWLKILYEEHLKYPDCLIANRVQHTRLDTAGNLYPYAYWNDNIDAIPTLPSLSYSNFFTSVRGVLYKKEFLHEDVLRKDIFMKLTPINDDIWIWAMAVLNGTKIRVPANAMRRPIFVDPDKEMHGVTLWRENMTKQDVQFRQVMEYYPALLETLIRADVDSEPYISVVLPVKSSTPPPTVCIENIFAQNFPDFELILINLGARVNLSPLPTNFRVINYPGGSLVDALNLGLRKAEGEYIFFANENSIFPRDALDVVARLANSSAAEVIHFAAHVEDGKFIPDDELNFESETPKFFGGSKQSRTLCWLQNKLSKRLDTKIFRREFLTKHGINFNDGTEEFLFAALIQAEKYLLVPQAFCSIRN